MSTTDYTAALDPLFDNHLRFFASHRARVERSAGWAKVNGLQSFLSSWTPLGEDVELGDARPPIRLIPSSAVCWPGRLAALGYEPGETLIYMELSGPLRDARPSPSVEIRVVRNDEEAADFAGIQSAAFLDEMSPNREWWINCFHVMARANHCRNDQCFHMALVNGTPAAVLLSVFAQGLCGIYAVATAPAFQRSGLSSLLLKAACDAAQARGDRRMILQAMADSYAQGFYGRHGFEERYRSRVWRLP